MKNLLIIFMSALLIALSPPLSMAGVDKKLHKECLYPTVLIRDFKAGSSGSGIIVRSQKIKEDLYHNVILTCGHIFANPEIIDDYRVYVGKYKDWSTIEGAEEYKANLYIKDAKRDLGVMVFSSKKKMPVGKLDFDTKLYIGNEIFRIGCGLGDQYRLDYGKVTSVNGTLDAHIKNTIRANVFTVPGDSGGPLFHKYKVVGITQAIRFVSNGWNRFPAYKISYFIPLSRFKTWSETLDNDLGFVYQDDLLPVLPFVMDEVKKYEYNTRMTPKTIWHK